MGFLLVIETIGVIASLCFAISGVPQMIRSIKEGHSNGVSHGTIWLWLGGEALMFLYTLLSFIVTNTIALSPAILLMVNYGFNFIVVGIVAAYKYRDLWKLFKICHYGNLNLD